MGNLFNQNNSNQKDLNQIKNKVYSIYNDEDEEHIIYIKNKIYSYNLTYYYDDTDNIYISDIYVKPKYRRKNFGNLLLEDAFQRVKNLKFKVLYAKVNKYGFESDWLKRKGFVFYSNLDKSDSDSKIMYCWFKKCFEENNQQINYTNSVLSTLKHYTNNDNITINTLLKDLNINIFDKFKIINFLEFKLKIKINQYCIETIFDDYNKVIDVINKLITNQNTNG